MALQDLTPQLRTRLSRMERAVGWFVMLATALLVFGFGFYIYKTAELKGWFKRRFHYQTGINNAAGLKVGDPVMLMGQSAGRITGIVPNKPEEYYGLTVYFEIFEPNYGYVWDDSKVVVSSDLLGHRSLEITKGVNGIPTIEEDTSKTPKVPVAMLRHKAAREARSKIAAGLNTSDPNAVKDELLKMAQADTNTFYTNLNDIYWIMPNEAPALSDRLQKVVDQVEAALPNFLALTNQLTATLSNATVLASNLNTVALGAQPTVSNLTVLTSKLDHPGALGDWLIPTNVNQKLDSVMGNADVAVANLNTNLANLNLSLINLSDMTSNLNHQVQVNSNILSNVSQTVTNADDFLQGLKHHWLLRSAFKKEFTNAPAATKPAKPALSPKDQDK
jgi:ABC-type transporter Mla subunit MlaD